MIYTGIIKIIASFQNMIRREVYYRYMIKKLQRRGLKIGKNVYVGQNVDFDHTHPYLIELGDDSRIGSDTLILAHDATTFAELGVTRLGKVRILAGTFIGRRCIILPGCTIGPRAMIAAGSVVNRDIGEGQMAAGNPARPYGKYSDLIDKYRVELDKSFVFENESYNKGNITQEEIIKNMGEINFAFIKGSPGKKKLINRIFWWGREYEWIK